MKAGQRVALACPYKELKRGDERGAFLRVLNGAKGTVSGATGKRSVVVVFDDIGGTVGVSVPAHWLAPLPEGQ